MTSVVELLFETLADLSDDELYDFKKVLWSQSHLPSEIPSELLMMADMQDTVFIMVQTFSQQSVEATMDVLNKMNRTDLVQRLSDSSSGPKSKTIKTNMFFICYKLFFFIHYTYYDL